MLFSQCEMKNKAIGKRRSQVRSTPSLWSQRKGTHVGVVISFVIFVTFIIFIYLAVQPKIGVTSKKNLLEQIKNNIIDSVSVEVTSVSVLLFGTGSSAICVKLDGFFTDSGMGQRIKVSNQAGQAIPNIKTEGTSLIVTKAAQDIFLNIYESEEFNPISSGSTCPISDYNLGLIKTRSSILESEITSLIEKHDSDYSSLKETLGVPIGNEIAFSLAYNDDTTIKTIQPNVSISVFSDDVLIRYIKQNGVEESGLLNVKIW